MDGSDSMNGLFTRIKELVPMEQAAQRYGFPIDRQHRIRCPFHDDRNPSLRLYPGARGWWCFVCNEGGSVIDFVAKLYGLPPLEAAKKLDADFHLGLTDAPPPSRRALRRQEHERLMKERQRQREEADRLAHVISARELRFAPAPPEQLPPDSPLWGEYASRLGELDYLDNCYFERG